MEQYLFYVGKIFAAVRTKDPKYNIMGGTEFYLGQKLASNTC